MNLLISPSQKICISEFKHIQVRAKFMFSLLRRPMLVLFHNSRMGMMITNSTGDILDVNASFSRITGYSRDEVLGKNPKALKSGHQQMDFYSKMWASLKENGYWEGEIWNRRKNGEIYAEWLTINKIKAISEEAIRYVGVFSDINSTKFQEAKWEHAAHHDNLTGLPNRLLLTDRISQAVLKNKRDRHNFAVIYIDLDGFKSVNDLYGHAAGDIVLVTLASRMRQCLRECDTLARIGGDEFLALMNELPEKSTCVPVLDRLLEVTQIPVSHNGFDLKVTASLGVRYCSSNELHDCAAIVDQADATMYQAKLTGKNKYLFF